MSEAAVSTAVRGSCTQPASHTKLAHASQKNPTRKTDRSGSVVDVSEGELLDTRRTGRMRSNVDAQALDGFEQRFVRRIQQLAFLPDGLRTLALAHAPQHFTQVSCDFCVWLCFEG